MESDQNSSGTNPLHFFYKSASYSVPLLVSQCTLNFNLKNKQGVDTRVGRIFQIRCVNICLTRPYSPTANQRTKQFLHFFSRGKHDGPDSALYGSIWVVFFLIIFSLCLIDGFIDLQTPVGTVLAIRDRVENDLPVYLLLFSFKYLL